MAALGDVRERFPLRRLGSLELRVTPAVEGPLPGDGCVRCRVHGPTRWYLCGVRLPRRLAIWVARRLA